MIGAFPLHRKSPPQNVEAGRPSPPLRASLPTSCPTAFFYVLDSSGHSRFVLRILIIRVSLSAFARARRYLGAAGGHPGFGRPSSLLRRRMRTPTRRGCDFPIALPGCTFRCGHSRFGGVCLDGSNAHLPRRGLLSDEDLWLGLHLAGDVRPPTLILRTGACEPRRPASGRTHGKDRHVCATQSRRAVALQPLRSDPLRR